MIAGVGGLGATVSQLLVRTGIGRLYLVDDGCLDWPDLNRQTLYGEKDIGRAKLPLAKERLNQINSEPEIVELFDEILAGAVQPHETIPVTPDNVGLMVNELFSVLWKTPKLLDRGLVVSLDNLNMAFLDI